MEESRNKEQRRRYAPPAVSTESLPLLPLVELTSGGTGIGGNSLPKKPGRPPPQ